MNWIWTAWLSEENKQKQEVVEHNICTKLAQQRNGRHKLDLRYWEAGCHHGLHSFCTVLHVTFHTALNNETCKILALGQDVINQVWERQIWEPRVNGWQHRAHIHLSLDPSGSPKDTTAYNKPCTTPHRHALTWFAGREESFLLWVATSLKMHSGVLQQTPNSLSR